MVFGLWWTNLLIPVGILVLQKTRFGQIRKRLPAALIGVFLWNLVWLQGIEMIHSPGQLRIGYYLWVMSFLLLGVATAGLLRHPESEGGSLLTPETDSSPWSRPASTVLAMFLLMGFALEALMVIAK